MKLKRKTVTLIKVSGNIGTKMTIIKISNTYLKYLQIPFTSATAINDNLLLYRNSFHDLRMTAD